MQTDSCVEKRRANKTNQGESGIERIDSAGGDEEGARRNRNGESIKLTGKKDVINNMHAQCVQL